MAVNAVTQLTTRRGRLPGLGPERSLFGPSEHSTDIESTRFESHALGALTVYLALVLFIPAQWVLPGLGAAGLSLIHI